jgi:4-hydroxy-3-methylbut-2-en-1-yl diphosphate reductase
MQVEIARSSGYCFGVRRALEITGKTLENCAGKQLKVFSIGQIIHNSGVIASLKEKGLIVVNNEIEIETGSVFIVRSHGMPSEILKRLKKKKIQVVDATCPFVKNAQSKAASLVRQGCFLVIIGDKNHPEVKSIINGIAEKNVCVVENLSELKFLDWPKTIGVVMQTTQIKSNVKNIISGLVDKSKKIIIENTICNTTEKRQDEVKELAGKSDVVIVVGSKNSANSTHLAEISGEINPNTYHVENFGEIDISWLKNKKNIGVTGGASTPIKDIEDVKIFIENLDKS